MIVNLPGDRRIIVDSKVPDLEFLEGMQSADEHTRAQAIAAHAAKLRLTVRALSEHRGPAPIAAKLYEETEEGRKAREAMQLQVKIARSVPGYDRGRPTKKDRRDFERVRRPDRD